MKGCESFPTSLPMHPKSASALAGTVPPARGRRVPLLLLVLLLAGCAPRPDVEAETCARLVPAFEPGAWRITAVEAEPATADGRRVVVRWRTAAGPAQRDAAAAARTHVETERALACRFAPRPSRLVPPELVAVETDAGPASEVTLFLLRELWLDRWAPTGVLAAPERWSALRYALQQAVNAIVASAVYGLLAIGYGLVYGLVGRIHLAFGDLTMLASYVGLSAIVAVTVTAPALALPLVLALALGASMLVGATASGATATGAFGRLWREAGQAPLIATLALSIAIREAVRLALGAREPWLPPLLPGRLAFEVPGGIELTVSAGQLLVLTATLAAYATVALLVGRSALGRAIRACADDGGMAALLGVNVPRVMAAGFAMGGALAGLAGLVLLLAYGSIGVHGGFLIGLKALTAAVLGGIGSVHGAMLGGLLIGGLETLWAAYVGGEWREVAVFAVLALVLVLRPEGIVGRPVLHSNDRFRPT